MNVGPACCLLLWASTIEVSSWITVIPSKSRPATRAGGMAPCRASIRFHTCSRTRAAAVFPSRAGVISSSARHTVVSQATDPNSSPWWRRVSISLIVLADRCGAISDGHRKIGQHPTPILHRPEPGPGQRRGQCAGQHRR